MEMDSELKKKLIIAGSIGVAIIAGIFIKNKVEQSRFKALDRATVVEMLKKGRKQTYGYYKQVATAATNIAAQMGTTQIDPNFIKAYLQSPDSPIKPQQNFEKIYTDLCGEYKTNYNEFNLSVDHYLKAKDKQIMNIVEQSEKDFQTSLSGRLPQLKVTVPPTLDKNRLIQITKKVSLKRYLTQVQMFRMMKGKTQQELMRNPQLMNKFPNPEVQQQKVLIEEGLGENGEPASAVYAAAVSKYRNDESFKKQIIKIQTNFTKVLSKYKLKISQNKMTQSQFNDLEDELVYESQAKHIERQAPASNLHSSNTHHNFQNVHNTHHNAHNAHSNAHNSNINHSKTSKNTQSSIIVPAFLDKQKLIQIQNKLSQRKYLIQIQHFRKTRGKSQHQISKDQQLVKSLPNAEVQEQKILQEYGLGENEQKPAKVFAAAVMKLQNDMSFRNQITKIENNYAKIFNKYKLKISQNKITESQLNDLEDELIYGTI